MKIDNGLIAVAVVGMTMLIAGQALAKTVSCSDAKFGTERWNECCVEGRS